MHIYIYPYKYNHKSVISISTYRYVDIKSTALIVSSFQFIFYRIKLIHPQAATACGPTNPICLQVRCLQQFSYSGKGGWLGPLFYPHRISGEGTVSYRIEEYWEFRNSTANFRCSSFKQDLKAASPFLLFTCPKSQIGFLHQPHCLNCL